jgi:hypothetical protein
MKLVFARIKRSSLAIPIIAGLLYSIDSTATTYTVTNTLDAGAGSLRQAITNANTNAGADNIIFNLGAGGPFTIALTSPLPALTDNSGLTIDGWDNSGNNGTPNTIPVFNANTATPMNANYMIILGNSAAVATGLILNSSNNIVQGLVLQNFGDGTPSANDIAITITGSSNSILGCYIGMDMNGTTKGARTATGISISGADNRVGDGTPAGANLISGINASLYGIQITGASASGNTVKGNIIGLQKDGVTLVANAVQLYGVYVTNQSWGNTIGGTISGEGNVISGNTNTGIYFNSTNTSGNTIYGNIIGPQANGSVFVATNTQSYGIVISGSPNNVIGSSVTASRNIISANESNGIRLTGAGSTGNSVKGNYVGIDITGTTFITSSSQDRGIFIDVSAASNTIGGILAGEGNLVSGNNNAVSSGEGIAIYTTGGGNIVQGNIIGPQANGSAWITGNLQHYGVMISSSPNNVIGGNSAGARNIISCNETIGLRITGAASTGNWVKGNYVGIDLAGTTYITGSTQDRGVYIDGSAVSNTIGGTAAGEGNVISANKNASTTADGIYINTNSINTGNTILGNIIGLQANGTSMVATLPQGTGINISSSPGNMIGNGTASGRNTISGNGTYGIYMTGATSTLNAVRGNCIGPSMNGSSFITGSSQDYGIYLTGSSYSNTIGGTTTGYGNLISGNTSMCIYIITNSAMGNSVQQNTIGPAAGGSATLTGGNTGQGIYISNSANNLIGGTLGANTRNIISANNNNGITVGGTSSLTLVQGNYIGIAADGITRIPGNIQSFGVSISPPASSNTIGGINAGEGNVMSGNSAVGGYYGIGASTGNAYLGNIVGLQANGTASVVGNTQVRGFDIHGSGLTIGSTNGGRNIISGNNSIGIYNALASASCNIVRGNYIGPSATGGYVAIQNTGIQIQQSASNYTIGGYLGGFGLNPEANLIAYNNGSGVNITSSVSVGNLVSRNLIYTNGSLTSSLPINLNYGASQGNNGKPAPAITNYNTTMVSGTAAATAGVGDTVEVFANTTGNCKDMMRYLGSTIGDAAGNWTLTGITVALNESLVATARTVAANNTSQASTCTLPLPVELISFKAECDNTRIKLIWVTASEQKSEEFILERSQDENTYSGIGIIKAAGKSYSQIEYSLADENAPRGTSYYRLKQVDKDGTHRYYKTLFFNNCIDERSGTSIYPNPADQTLTVSMPGEEDGMMRVEVIDPLGKIIFDRELHRFNGEIALRVDEFAPGAYVLKVNSVSGEQYFKFLKN